MNQRRIQPGDFYRHFKNKVYQIISIAYHSETGEKLVVYQALYGDFKVYVRAYDMFVSEVDREKYPEVTQKFRFEKVMFTSDGQIGLAEQNLELVHQNDHQATDTENAPTKLASDNLMKDSLIHTQIDNPEKSSTEIQKSSTETEEAVVNPLLLSFLDLDTFEKKLESFIDMRDKMDDKLLDDIAAVLDIVVDEGSFKQRYESIKNCLITYVRFEDNRLR